jgi:hypothetical protein
MLSISCSAYLKALFYLWNVSHRYKLSSKLSLGILLRFLTKITEFKYDLYNEIWWMIGINLLTKQDYHLLQQDKNLGVSY